MLVIASVITMFFYSLLLTFIALIISVLTAFVSIRINNSIKKHAKKCTEEICKIGSLVQRYNIRLCYIKDESGSVNCAETFFTKKMKNQHRQKGRG